MLIKTFVSNIAIDEKEAEGTMDFPAVTICNVNAIRISKLTKDDVYHVGQFFGLIQSDGVSLLSLLYFTADFSSLMTNRHTYLKTVAKSVYSIHL